MLIDALNKLANEKLNIIELLNKDVDDLFLSYNHNPSARSRFGL